MGPVALGKRDIVVGMAFGLAACKPPADPSLGADAHHPSGTPSSAAVPLRVQAPGTAAPPPAAPRLLPPAALAARFTAQRAILGAEHLFEDLEGRPLAPLPATEELADEDETPGIDDTILDALPGSSGLGDPLAATGPRVNGNALGLFAPIQDPASGPALQSFYTALDALARGEDEDGKVRVLVYGASHTDADVYPQYLRRYLQERFGDGGHGYIHIAKPWRWYGHFDMEVDGLKYWKTEHAQRTNGRDDGRFGLLGASLSTTQRKAFGRVSHRNGTTASHYELYYLEQPRGGSFRILVDDKPAGTISTRAKEIGPGYHALTLPEGPHAIEVQPVGNGEIRLFGLTAERERPGVVVDTLGIGGTRAANMLSWDYDLWGDHIRKRDPSLIVLAYGTNEAMDTDQSLGAYRARLSEVLQRLRSAAPQASCLLMGPGDFPQAMSDGHFGPRPRLRQIVEIQADVALAAGCGFWDTLAFMGGELSMVQWVHAIPRMAKDDYIHLTRRGYVRMGMALVDAMMEGFDGVQSLPDTAASAYLGAP